MNKMLLPTGSYCQNIIFLAGKEWLRSCEFKKYSIFQKILNGKKVKASIIPPRGKEYKSGYFRKMIKEMLYCYLSVACVYLSLLLIFVVLRLTIISRRCFR